MTNKPLTQISPRRRVSAWLIHLFTASAAIIGLYTLYATYQGYFILAFWLMGITIFIDSIDGTLARTVGVKTAAPRIDGALLDNIVDYLNYVITPAFFLLVSTLIPGVWKIIGASAIVLTSAYQFTQSDAKTADHFFKGFPSYWNLVVFYLYIGHLSPWVNLAIILFLSFMIFVPIKYLYLSRIDYVSPYRSVRIGLMIATLIYAGATIILLAIYPRSNPILIGISWAFGAIYVALSLYRTFFPMPIEDETKSPSQ